MADSLACGNLSLQNISAGINFRCSAGHFRWYDIFQRPQAGLVVPGASIFDFGLSSLRRITGTYFFEKSPFKLVTQTLAGCPKKKISSFKKWSGFSPRRYFVRQHRQWVFSTEQWQSKYSTWRSRWNCRWTFLPLSYPAWNSVFPQFQSRPLVFPNASLPAVVWTAICQWRLSEVQSPWLGLVVLVPAHLQEQNKRVIFAGVATAVLKY